MSLTAVDVVLLPDNSTSQIAIDINSELVEKFGDEIVLNKTDCLPHISLAMGCMESDDLPAVSALLKTIVNQCPIESLLCGGIVQSENSIGQAVSWLKVETESSLFALHQVIVNEMQTYFKYQATYDSIFQADKVSISTLKWINKYKMKSSFENFNPHITLGYGQTETVLDPFDIKIDKLAVCHLGDHCTCRKVLFEVSM